MLHLIQNLPINTLSVFLIHPDYFEKEEPIFRKESTDLSVIGKEYKISIFNKKVKQQILKIYKIFNRIKVRLLKAIS